MGKKKKGGKKKGSKKSSSGGEGKSKAELESVGPTELELSLRLELETLEADLTRAKQEAEEARVQHEWLREELQKTRDETRDYESYMRKKTMREHARMQGLSDQNQRDIDSVNAERTRRSKEFEAAKKDLGDRILEKEGELQRINGQLAELVDYKVKREEQSDEINALEAKIKHLKMEHAEKLQEIKSGYIDEKIRFQTEASKAVTDIETQAVSEALDCLDDHAARVRRENKALRQDLLRLFAENKVLRERETFLKRENVELVRQQDLNIDVTAEQTARLTRRLSRGMLTVNKSARFSLV
eukprot:UC1_evm1s378